MNPDLEYSPAEASSSTFSSTSTSSLLSPTRTEIVYDYVTDVDPNLVSAPAWLDWSSPPRPPSMAGRGGRRQASQNSYT